MTSPYRTNFEKDSERGNVLKQGTDLVITIDAGDGLDPVYVAGTLWRESRRTGSLKAIQGEQTGRKTNPSKDSIKFEMVDPDGSAMRVGKYRVETRWSFGAGDLGIGDNFEVVA
jgi:hypothetical protein